MDSYLIQFDKAVNLINVILLGAGSNIFDQHWSQGVRGKLLRFIGLVIVTHVPISNVTALYYNQHDFVMIAQTVMIIMTGFQANVKIITIQFRSKNFIGVLNLCRKFHITYEKDIENERKTSKDMEYLKRPLLTIRAIAILYTVAVCAKLFNPLFHEKRILPMDYYLPIGPPFESPQYEINYVYILIHAPVDVCIFIGVDGIFILLVSEACLQFDVIRYKLSTIGFDQTSNGETETEKLREIYFMHEEFVRLVNAINSTYSLILLGQFLSSFIMISCSMFLLDASSIDTLMYCLAVFMQLSLFCWFGQLLKNKLDVTIMSMYDNKWYNLNNEQRKSLVIMMSCAQPNLSLTAGGISEICMETYLAILKTTYSYYAIMKDTTAK